MNKRKLVYCLTAFVCIYFAACENQIMGKWWEEPVAEKSKINIAVPVISVHPQSAVYAIGTTVQPMTIEAAVSDNGRLSYQWYSNVMDNNSGGTIIAGATGTNYTSPANQNGVIYYYVVVTNTISDNNGDIMATASAVSHTAGIEVDVLSVTITGLSVQSKIYDGTAEAAITGTPVLQGVVNGDDVTLVQGTVVFADANAGNNKRVIFSGWSLGGADAAGYTLRMPNLTANITKADPVVNWPDGLVGFIDQTLSQIKLPGNGTSIPGGTFNWTTPSDSVSSTVLQSHNMTFIPDDTLNYNILTSYVTIKVVSPVKMVSIPDGSFKMGSPVSEPDRFPYEEQHTVNVSGFYMSEHLITQELYKAVMGNNPSDFTKPVTGESETPNKLPVEQVSWYDALVFCNRLSMIEGLSPAYQINNKTNPMDWGPVPVNQDPTWDAVIIVPGSNGYRLPTEAQWEYACRAGTTTAYNTGAYFNDNIGWYSGNSGQITHKVGLKPSNAWGLYDMHGNVLEWCWDWYYSSYSGIGVTLTDPTGPQTGTYRIVRGGYWDYSPGFMRSAWRSSNSPYARVNTSGIRLVLPK